MLSVTYAQLNAWITAFLWPFARIMALVATAPILGYATLPSTVKIGLAAFVTMIVAPTLTDLPTVTAFSAAGVWIMVNQVIIGVVLGLTMQVVFAAVEMAGSFVGLQMGLGFATFFDPGSDASSEVLSSFLNTVAMLAFLAFDGPAQLIGAIAQSFQSTPITAGLLGTPGLMTYLRWSSTIFSAGLLMSLPIVIAVLITNLLLGMLNRAAPQIGVFQIGFATTLLVGMLLLQLMLPDLIPIFGQLFDMGIDAMGRVAAGLR